MLSPTRILPLAVTIVLLASPALSDPEPQWPYNLPPEVKYFPEDAPHVSRAVNSMRRLGLEMPVGVRKMGTDPSEMFFLDYWQFGSQDDFEESVAQFDVPWTPDNSLISPPLLPHSCANPNRRGYFGLFKRAALAKRDFQCPTGYNACTGISRPNSCCASGSTCVIVKDTGLGDVGCCPGTASCGTGVSLGSCNTNAGWTSCPTGPNGGGCCMSGYTCFSVGCLSVSTSTTTTTLPTGTVAGCAAGYTTCPAGGCCATGYTCGASNSCIPPSATTTTSAAIIQPGVRPNGGSSSTTASSTSVEPATPPTTTYTVGTQLIGVCPTGYFFCSAYYRPGCCRIGRGCAMTDCPAAASSSFFVSNGVTVAVPVGASTGGLGYTTTGLITLAAGASPGCPGNWAACGSTQGGGCCPVGYSCGLADCTAGTSVVAKIAASMAAGRAADVFGWAVVALGSVFGLAMILL